MSRSAPRHSRYLALRLSRKNKFENDKLRVLENSKFEILQRFFPKHIHEPSEATDLPTQKAAPVMPFQFFDFPTICDLKNNYPKETHRRVIA